MDSNTTDTRVAELPDCPHCDQLAADVRRLTDALRAVSAVAVGATERSDNVLNGLSDARS